MCDKFRFLNIISFMHGTIHFYWKLYLKKSFTSMITFHPSMDIGCLGVFNFIYEQFSIQMVYFIIDVYSKVSFMSSIFFSIILIFTSHSYFLFCLFLFCFFSIFLFSPFYPILEFFPSWSQNSSCYVLLCSHVILKITISPTLSLQNYFIST